MGCVRMIVNDLHELLLKFIFESCSITLIMILGEQLVVKKLVLTFANFNLNGVVSDRDGVQIKLLIEQHRLRLISDRNHDEKRNANAKAQTDEF